MNPDTAMEMACVADVNEVIETFQEREKYRNGCATARRHSDEHWEYERTSGGKKGGKKGRGGKGGTIPKGGWNGGKGAVGAKRAAEWPAGEDSSAWEAAQSEGYPLGELQGLPMQISVQIQDLRAKIASLQSEQASASTGSVIERLAVGQPQQPPWPPQQSTVAIGSSSRAIRSIELGKVQMIIDSIERAKQAALAMQRSMQGTSQAYSERAAQAMNQANQFADEAAVMNAAKAFLLDFLRGAPAGIS